MKKIILIVALFLNVFNQFSFGQCVPNTTLTQPGIYPDSATGLDGAVVNQPYNQVIQLVVPADTSLGPIPIPINSIQLVSFSGLPAGLTYACNPSNCIYPGGTNGCVLISGTPTVAGNFQLSAILTTSFTVFGSTQTQTDTVDYYSIDVTNSTGLNEDGLPSFSMSQNMPNPCEDFTAIKYSLPFSTKVDFYLHNVLGKEVFHKILEGDQGENSLRLDARDFDPGVYIYTMTVGGESLTKRLVISKK